MHPVSPDVVVFRNRISKEIKRHMLPAEPDEAKPRRPTSSSFDAWREGHVSLPDEKICGLNACFITATCTPHLFDIRYCVVSSMSVLAARLSFSLKSTFSFRKVGLPPAPDAFTAISFLPKLRPVDFEVGK